MAKISKEYAEFAISNFLVSEKRSKMLTGNQYYIGKHDICNRKRTAIGETGEPTEVTNLPNNQIVDNQYKKMVDQKSNYLTGQPISIQCDNDVYSKLLREFIDKKFMRILKNITEDSLNCGIAWLCVHYNEKGELSFKRFNPTDVFASWRDVEHTILDYAIRIYELNIYDEEKNQSKLVKKVEIYDDDGIRYFTYNSGQLTPEEPYHNPYFTFYNSDDEKLDYNWHRIPLIPFKYNSREIPLLNSIKSLQDGLNMIESNFQNNMEEDARNTILVIKNYDGENLGEFRRNLATYGAVKLRGDHNGNGDITTLEVEVNAENYQAILQILKRAIIENAKGFDAKDERMHGNPNQMNIQSMYSDIDLDANGMETEYQASFEDLLFFINSHLYNTGAGDFFNEKVDIIFNRDIMVSETEAINNCQKSVGILSEQTIIANHPWVDDPQAEIKRKEEERNKELEDALGYNEAFEKETERILEQESGNTRR